MTKSKLALLYERYIAGVCSESELAELERYFESDLHEAELKTLASSTWKELDLDTLKIMPADRSEEIYERIITRKSAPYFRTPRWTIAAAIFIVAISSLLLINANKDGHGIRTNFTQNIPEINPASNKAVLTLANGTKIILEGKSSGKAAAGSSNQLDAIGRLLPGVDDASHEKLAMNTITIPRGGQYNVILPDQTVVHLNSGSVLTFPTEFKGTERRVSLIGEAYFEVSKNARMPFKVSVNNLQEVEVLGTHFNIKAYADDAHIFTTLAEGSVKVSSDKGTIFLKPGQMSINNRSNGTLTSKVVNVEEELAWQQGFFIFDNENITDVMKNLSKWYDVDVAFSGDTKNINLLGNYSRKKSLNSLLKTIELSNKVKFKIEGRRVTVIAQ